MQDQAYQSDSHKEKLADQLSFFRKIGSKFSGIRFKIQSLAMLSAFGGIIIILLLCYFIVQNIEKKNVASVLEIMASGKKEQITNYFHNLDLKAKAITSDSQFKSAFNDFKNAFNTIESDSYETNVASNLSEISPLLQNYYITDFINPLNSKTNFTLNYNSFLPTDNKARILQFLYIANNNNSPGLKNRMINAGDNSNYSQVHSTYHAIFKNFMLSLEAEDVLLVESESGNIIYSYQKNPDFGTNIIDGPYKNTNLARAYQKAITTANTNKLVTSDIDLYLPAMMKPVLYAAIAFDNLSGVLIFQISAERISEFINASVKIDNGSFKIVNTYLTGIDYALRTDDRRIKTDKKDLIDKLSGTNIRNDKLMLVDSLNTCIRLLNLSPEIFSKAVLGYTEVKGYKDFTGTNVLGNIQPVNFGSEKMYLVIQGQRKYLLNASALLLKLGIPVAVLLMVIIFLISSGVEKKLHLRINRIRDILISLASGKPVKTDLVLPKDELDKIEIDINSLSVRMRKASEYAMDLSLGNISTVFEAVSENDFIANSLNKIKESLIQRVSEDTKRKEEDQVRGWITEGTAKFNDLLRQHNDNLDLFTNSILKNIIEYLNANQGGLFLLEGEGNEERIINLVASYAYDRKKHLQKKIKVGEGLLGMCVLEKKYIYLKDIPEEYIEITSGLGHASPRNLLIMPLKYNDDIVGLFELASFYEFKPYELEFVEKIADSTANTLNSVRLNVRTKELLQESNERAEELSAQEEEMRQNLEELKATQEEMSRIKEEEGNKEKIRREQEQKILAQMKEANNSMIQKQKELEWEKEMFNALMDNLNERITFKDIDSKYLRINLAKVKALGLKSSDEVTGKTDFDIFGGTHHQKALEEEKSIISLGESIQNKEEKIESKDGSHWWATNSRIPLKNDKGEIGGLLVITQDITNLKNALFELELYNKLFNDTVSLLPVIKYSFDKEGKILSFKGMGMNLLGFKEKDLIDKNFFVLYPEARNIYEMESNDEAFNFLQKGNDWELKHVIFVNPANYGGFTGIAFDTKLLEKGT